MRKDDDLRPAYDGQRKSLSPAEVERLEELGYRCEELRSFKPLSNGNRWCRIYKPKGDSK